MKRMQPEPSAQQTPGIGLDLSRGFDTRQFAIHQVSGDSLNCEPYYQCDPQ